MKIEHTRIQHSIGQGFFHTGSVSVGDDVFNYVYDCGSTSSGPLNSSISEYVDSLDGKCIDALFLSHLDFDHVAGLERLLVLASASTAVLPYLSPAGRLALIAKAIDNETLTGSLLGLLADPTGWLVARGVQNVIFVAPADPPPDEPPDWTAPGEPGPFLVDESARGLHPDRERIGDSGKLWLSEWLLVDDTNGLRAHSKNRSSVTRMSCLQPLRLVDSKLSWVNWQFVTFVQPEGQREKEFLLEVKRKFPRLISKNKFELDQKKLLAILQNPSERQTLAACYSMIRANRNLTSLSVFSGPIKVYSQEDLSYSCNQYPLREFWPYWIHPDLRVGWLGTGDAKLSGPKRRNAFMTHFDSLRESVLTFSLPHHGARKHFHRQLVDYGRLFVTSAGESNSYGHPHPETTVLVDRRDGRFLWSTTESKPSQLVEHVTVGAS